MCVWQRKVVIAENSPSFSGAAPNYELFIMYVIHPEVRVEKEDDMSGSRKKENSIMRDVVSGCDRSYIHIS